jgi:maleate isomerase
MYGSRGRIGHICPSAPLDMILNEFQALLPDGVLAVYSSLHIERLQQSDFDRAIATLDVAAGHMLEGEVDAVIVGGGPVVAALGSDEAVVNRTREIVRAPTQSTTGAMLAGMQQLGARKLIVATPYTDERNQLLKTYLEGQGFTVVGTRGLGTVRGVDVARLPFDATYRLGCEAFDANPSADALYMPCARMPMVRNIDAIEQTTGIPVVSSTQAMAWWGLRAMGIEDHIDGFGRLMREPLSANTERAQMAASA